MRELTASELGLCYRTKIVERSLAGCVREIIDVLEKKGHHFRKGVIQAHIDANGGETPPFFENISISVFDTTVLKEAFAADPTFGSEAYYEIKIEGKPFVFIDPGSKHFETLGGRVVVHLSEHEQTVFGRSFVQRFIGDQEEGQSQISELTEGEFHPGVFQVVCAIMGCISYLGALELE